VNEDVVAVLALAVEDRVVAGAAGLVGDRLHNAAARRNDRGALGRGQVLAYVAAAAAVGAEARALAAVGELAHEREAVVVEADLGAAAGRGRAAEAAAAPVAGGDPDDVAALGQRAPLAPGQHVGVAASRRTGAQADRSHGSLRFRLSTYRRTLRLRLRDRIRKVTRAGRP
jgi:hypothetical protein